MGGVLDSRFIQKPLQNAADKYGEFTTPQGATYKPGGNVGSIGSGGGSKAEEPDQSARAIIRATLAEYGLESLADWAWGQFLAGAPIEQIMLDIRQRDEYKARFPGLQALRSKGRAISEREYIATERTIFQLFQANRFPTEVFGTREFIGNLIGNEVSPQEVSDRIGTLEADLPALISQSPEIAAELEAVERYYGVRPELGELAAFVFSDQGLPVIQKRLAAVRADRAAGRAGYGDLAREEAERLADLGVTEDQATEGFGALAASRELFEVLPGGRGDSISRQEQMGAAFEGDTLAQQRIERKRRQRLAKFESGGRYAGGQSGFSGIGSAT